MPEHTPPARNKRAASSACATTLPIKCRSPKCAAYRSVVQATLLVWTTRTHWADDDGPEIAEDEWRLVVEADPDLAMAGFVEARTSDGRVLRTDDPSIAQMVTHPRLAEHGNWFSFFF